MLFSLHLPHLLSPPDLTLRLAKLISESEDRKHPFLLNCLGKACWVNNKVPSPQEGVLGVFSIPFCLQWRDWSLFFFFFRKSHTEILLFKQKSLKQFTLSLGGCHRNLWQHRETGPALHRCYPCMACNARLFPPSRFDDYMKLCKAKQLLLNGCRWAEWMQSGSCHSKVRQCLSAGSKKWSVSRRSIPNIPNFFKLDFSSEASFLTPITLY